MLSGRLWRDWDQSHAQPDQRGKVPFPNTVVDLVSPGLRENVSIAYYVD